MLLRSVKRSVIDAAFVSFPSLQLFVFTLHCACALRIPDTIYITQSSIDVEEAAAAESGIATELVAPEASNLNQFYQHQNYPKINFFQRPAHQYSPFLYMGPLILTEDPGRLSPQNDQKNIERNSVSQEKNSYKLYRPSPQDNPQFVDMLPPSETQEEPNYHSAKPKKNKKFSEKDDGEKKKTFKKKQNSKKNILKNEVFKNNDEDLTEKQQESAEEVVNSSEDSNEYQARRQRETSSTKEDYDEEPVEESQPASRLDFAMHGN